MIRKSGSSVFYAGIDNSFDSGYEQKDVLSNDAPGVYGGEITIATTYSLLAKARDATNLPGESSRLSLDCASAGTLIPLETANH